MNVASQHPYLCDIRSLPGGNIPWKAARRRGRSKNTDGSERITTLNSIYKVIFRCEKRFPDMLLCRISALARRGLGVRRVAAVRPALSFSSAGDAAAAAGAGAQSPGGEYRQTVLLPRTDFPMKLSGQKLLDLELQIQRVTHPALFYT